MFQLQITKEELAHILRSSFHINVNRVISCDDQCENHVIGIRGSICRCGNGCRGGYSTTGGCDLQCMRQSNLPSAAQCPGQSDFLCDCLPLSCVRLEARTRRRWLLSWTAAGGKWTTTTTTAQAHKRHTYNGLSIRGLLF